MAKVIVAHGEILSKNGDINIARLKNSVIKSLRSLFDNLALKEVLLQIFPRPGKVGVKINTIAGKKLSTRPEVALTLSQILAENKSRSIKSPEEELARA